jgi:hypothetical protein
MRDQRTRRHRRSARCGSLRRQQQEGARGFVLALLLRRPVRAQTELEVNQTRKL